MNMYTHSHTHKYMYVHVCTCVCVWPVSSFPFFPSLNSDLEKVEELGALAFF